MAKNLADLTGARTKQSNGNGHGKAKGLRFSRFFTPPGSHAFDLVEWERRTAAITGEKGQVIFEQKDVEVPRTWSQLAINVVAQKYFRGSPGSPERETSVRQIIDRVVETLAKWGREGAYFATEEDAENSARRPARRRDRAFPSRDSCPGSSLDFSPLRRCVRSAFSRTAGRRAHARCRRGSPLPRWRPSALAWTCAS